MDKDDRRLIEKYDHPDPVGDACCAPSGGSGIHLSRGQLEAWAGRALTDDELSRLEDAIPNSSIPDAVWVIVDSFC